MHGQLVRTTSTSEVDGYIYGVHSCTADNHEMNITLKGYRAIGNE